MDMLFNNCSVKRGGEGDMLHLFLNHVVLITVRHEPLH